MVETETEENKNHHGTYSSKKENLEREKVDMI